MMKTNGLIWLWLVGCGSLSAPQQELREAGNAEPELQDRFVELQFEDARKSEVGLRGGAESSGVALDAVIGGQGNAPAVSAPPGEPEADNEEAPDDAEAAEVGEARRWFPEAFLWQPLVQTGDDGVATLDVRVPDQLTTWRVLGLAHDNEGHQAGAVHTFDSRLPVYVDPVVPAWLMDGDRLVLPVQAVNSTAQSIVATLTVEATGAIRAQGRASISLTAGSSDVRSIPMNVTGAGQATVMARLSAGQDSDAAERTIPVVPSGRPVLSTRGSTLSSSRSFQLPPPTGANATTEELQVVVFPGPLAVLQAEVERLQGGARPEDGAYGFALATHMQALTAAAGVESDPEVVRKLMLLAWQQTVFRTRSPDSGQAADLLASLQHVQGHELVSGVVPRLQQVLQAGQRADGTWSRHATSTVPRVMVDTAMAVAAMPTSAEGPRLRAMGAVERYARDIEDGFTAAVVLAADLAEGPQAERLLELVTDGLVESDSGAWTVSVPAGAQDSWDRTPSRATMLAFTVLALPASHEARGDLVSELMGGWNATRGFGAGMADTWALQAIVSALPGAAQKVDVSLALDGVSVATSSLDPAQPLVPALLDARPGGRDAEITVTVTPQVPGLSFVATRRSWVPWAASDRVDGVDLRVSASRLARGEPGSLKLTAAAPSGSVLVIEQPLPAGATVQPGAHVAARGAGATIDVFVDRVRLETRPFQAGEILQIDLPVTPAFAGRFTTPPVLVRVDGGPPVPLKPIQWLVGGG